MLWFESSGRNPMLAEFTATIMDAQCESTAVTPLGAELNRDRRIGKTPRYN